MSKLLSIIHGWRNLAFESPEIENMAGERAVYCGECANAVPGIVAEMIGDEIKDIKGLVCNGCSGPIKCPLSAKIRSPYEKCPIGLWQAITK